MEINDRLINLTEEFKDCPEENHEAAHTKAFNHVLYWLVCNTGNMDAVVNDELLDSMTYLYRRQSLQSMVIPILSDELKTLVKVINNGLYDYILSSPFFLRVVDELKVKRGHDVLELITNLNSEI